MIRLDAELRKKVENASHLAFQEWENILKIRDIPFNWETIDRIKTMVSLNNWSKQAKNTFG